jgi:hypothetical protein
LPGNSLVLPYPAGADKIYPAQDFSDPQIIQIGDFMSVNPAQKFIARNAEIVRCRVVEGCNKFLTRGFRDSGIEV